MACRPERRHRRPGGRNGLSRRHRVAGGDAGVDLESWRAVGRDAVIFPEVAVLADALPDPAVAQPEWAGSGVSAVAVACGWGVLPSPRGAGGAGLVGAAGDGRLRRSADRVGGDLIRLRRHPEGLPGPFVRIDENLWRVRQKHQPATMDAQLRDLGKERASPCSGTTRRSVVPAEQRALITALVDEAGEQPAQLRGAQHATIKRAVLNKVGTIMSHWHGGRSRHRNVDRCATCDCDISHCGAGGAPRHTELRSRAPFPAGSPVPHAEGRTADGVGRGVSARTGARGEASWSRQRMRGLPCRRSERGTTAWVACTA